MTDWKLVIGIILLIVALVGFIVMMSILEGRSRRERGLPKKEKKTGKSRHEK